MRRRELLHRNSRYISCACGCGELLKEYNTNGKKSKFMQGHWLVGLKGGKCGSWKGGVTMESQGYRLVYAPSHHFAYRGFYVKEHRYVWEQYNKAVLLPWGDVHHKNGDKLDNRPENLEAMMKYQHMVISAKEKSRDSLGRFT